MVFRNTIQNPLSRQYNQEVEVFRLSDIEGTNKQEYKSYLTGVPCNIQPLDDDFSEGLEGSLGKNYLMFCDILDIEINDLIFHNGKKYKVVGKENFEVFIDTITHMELVIREFIND